jgi:hypothetical protein
VVLAKYGYSRRYERHGAIFVCVDFGQYWTTSDDSNRPFVVRWRTYQQTVTIGTD